MKEAINSEFDYLRPRLSLLLRYQEEEEDEEDNHIFFRSDKQKSQKGKGRRKVLNIDTERRGKKGKRKTIIGKKRQGIKGAKIGNEGRWKGNS